MNLGRSHASKSAENGQKTSTVCGAALADLKDFPKNAMQDVGFQLDKISKGQDPDDFKAIPRVGRGAMELRVWDEEGTFRILYVAKFEDAVYVLHCFKKTTQKIPDADIDIAKNRYKSI